MAAKKPISVDTLFANPIFEHIIGTRNDVEKKFEGKLNYILRDIERIVVV